MPGEYLERRPTETKRWRAADACSTYTLRMSTAELATLVAQVDKLIRPHIAATRADPAPRSRTVHLGLQAFRGGEPG